MRRPRLDDAERHDALPGIEQRAPRAFCAARLRQPRELRVAVEKALQVIEPLFDGVVDLIEAMELFRPVANDPRRMKERTDRRQRVVQLVIQHANGALPYFDLLPPQLRRQTVRNPEEMLA